MKGNPRDGLLGVPYKRDSRGRFMKHGHHDAAYYRYQRDRAKGKKVSALPPPPPLRRSYKLYQELAAYGVNSFEELMAQVHAKRVNKARLRRRRRRVDARSFWH